MIPRLKQFTVVGIFEVGMVESTPASRWSTCEDAQTLYQMGDGGVAACASSWTTCSPRAPWRASCWRSSPPNVFASDWTRSHANFFRAVEIEKRMMFIILALIVAVAAFNIVSTLVMR